MWHIEQLCVSACLAWLSGAEWDRAQHHHGEETRPPAAWRDRGYGPALWQWLTDRRTPVVPPPDLWDPAERLWAHRYSGRVFQWGKKNKLFGLHARNWQESQHTDTFVNNKRIYLRKNELSFDKLVWMWERAQVCGEVDFYGDDTEQIVK